MQIEKPSNYRNLSWFGIALWALALHLCVYTRAQAPTQVTTKIQAIEQELKKLDSIKSQLLAQREDLKLEKIRADIRAVGLPQGPGSDQIVWHSAMALAYSEPHEQARWVAHMIIPDVTEGVVSRSNDFRPDSLITTGSAVEADYFVKFLQPDSTYKYDGSGYDRGHLAPSADFRWSAKALSESYLYSNMSPQLADFNRGIWGDLEDKLREYVYKNPGTYLHVVTGPVLEPNLPRIERGVNKVPIPRYYWKVAYDVQRQRGIGFVLPNAAGTQPLELHAVTIDSVQRLTGLKFFTGLPAAEQTAIAQQRITKDWFSEVASGDVEPVPIYELKKGQINTIMARNIMNSNTVAKVVGTVVSGRKSRAGNIILNLDKQYPNEIFSIFIKKDDIPNFPYDVLATLKGKRIAVSSKVADLGGKPTAYVEAARGIEVF
ncbi:MAG TPA: DNA/RNA non-specific endonuclease [Phnomibacter sp.]|nr:DNA/RNA non-specific endonuclease [Phnomibacter sp.]